MGGAGPGTGPSTPSARHGAEQAPPHPSAQLLVRAPPTLRCRPRTTGSKGHHMKRTRSARRQQEARRRIGAGRDASSRPKPPRNQPGSPPRARADPPGPILRRRACRALRGACVASGACGASRRLRRVTDSRVGGAPLPEPVWRNPRRQAAHLRTCSRPSSGRPCTDHRLRRGNAGPARRYIYSGSEGLPDSWLRKKEDQVLPSSLFRCLRFAQASTESSSPPAGPGGEAASFARRRSSR